MADPVGARYYAVGLVGGTTVHLRADWVETPTDGALRAWRDPQGDERSQVLVFTAAPGQWQYHYPADMTDGTPPAVTRWPGVVDRGHPNPRPPSGGAA